MAVGVLVLLPPVATGTELTIAGDRPEWKKMAEYCGWLMMSEITDRLSADDDNDGDSITLPLQEEEDDVVPCSILRISPCRNRELMLLSFAETSEESKIQFN